MSIEHMPLAASHVAPHSAAHTQHGQCSTPAGVTSLFTCLLWGLLMTELSH